MPYVQCDWGFCITLHPKVLVVGGTSRLRERAKSQVSSWWWTECGLLLCESVVCVYVNLLDPSSVVSPGSPFIASRGGQVFTWVDFFCWMVKTQSRPYWSWSISSLGDGWQYGCSCRGLPSPVGVAGVGSPALLHILSTVRNDLK